MEPDAGRSTLPAIGTVSGSPPGSGVAVAVWNEKRCAERIRFWPAVACGNWKLNGASNFASLAAVPVEEP